MRLTTEEENQIIEQFERKLVGCVLKFRPGKPGSYSDYDDLLQEARIAFLLHIRKAEDRSTFHVCEVSVFCALHKYVEDMSLISIPHYRFPEESKAVQRAADDIYNLDEGLFVDRSASPYEEVLMDQFLASLPDKHREVLRLKLEGFNQQEITQMLGFDSFHQVFRIMKNLRQQYKRWFCEEDSEAIDTDKGREMKRHAAGHRGQGDAACEPVSSSL